MQVKWLVSHDVYWQQAVFMYKKLCRCRRMAWCVLSLVTTKVTFKLAQDHWYSCHSIGQTWFPI